jgi:hypothetical protein
MGQRGGCRKTGDVNGREAGGAYRDAPSTLKPRPAEERNARVVVHLKKCEILLLQRQDVSVNRLHADGGRGYSCSKKVIRVQKRQRVDLSAHSARRLGSGT